MKVLVCRPLENAGFANGFSTRLGGVSPFPESDLNLAGFDEDSSENIQENRRRFLAVFDSEYKFATAWQVHGDNIRIVRSDGDIENSSERADALVSDWKNVLVGVKTADCVPVLIGDPEKNVFAAVHAGWRGTAASILQKVVSKLKDMYGSDPKNFVCAIGPAAGHKNYEVGQDVIDIFAKNFSTGGKYFTRMRGGHARVDLPGANKDQLIESGVSVNNIFTAPFCTIERNDLFFSYRIEKKKYGRTGRLLSVIGRLQDR